MSAFFPLKTTAVTSRYALQITPDLCVGPQGRQFMFGGVGLGAGLAALTRTVDAPIILASAHFLSFARPPQTLTLDVDTLKAGRYIKQTCVEGRVADDPVFRVSASMGSRPDEHPNQWQIMPTVPRPENCAHGRHWRSGETSIHSQLDVRVAHGRYGRDREGHPDPDGRLLLWVRPRNREATSVPFLGILADLIPAGVGNALGINAGGNSLDITLRLTNAPLTEWVLVEIRIAAIMTGLVHGTATLYNEDGDLLGMASQSLILRIHPPIAKQ